jgi:hypothetical protein
MNYNTDSLKINFFILIRAVIFSLCMLAPTIWEHHRSDGMSFNIFHDSDEIVYLNIAKGYAEHIGNLGIYKEHSHQKSFSELLHNHRPDHFISHYLLGMFSKKLNLNVTTLNILLDFFFIITSYFVLTLFIYNVTSSKHLKWEVVTISMLLLPFITSIENYFRLTPILNNSIVYESIINPPFILEAFETQFSILWMSICLFIWSHPNLKKLRKLLLLGILHGMLIYIYVLAWIYLFIFIAILLSLESIRKKLSFKQFFLKNILFIISSLTISAYGIYLIAGLNFGSYSDELKEVINGVYYLPAEWLILSIVLLVTYFVTASHSCFSKPLLILTAAILSELIVLNVQPITQIFTTGIYISAIYIRPLVTAMFLVIIFNFEITILRKHGNIKLLVLGLNLVTLFSCFYVLSLHKVDEEQISTLHFIRNSDIKNKTFAVITFKPPFSDSTNEWNVRWEPNAFAVTTDNYLLHENLFSLNLEKFKDESILRELLLGLIFKGKPSLIRPCKKHITTIPQQLFFLPWMISESSRITACNSQESLIMNPDPCALSSMFSVDYILLESDLIKSLPEVTLKFSQLKWRSPGGKYEIYSYDMEKKIEHYCKTENDPLNLP